MKSEHRDTKSSTRKQSFRFWFYVGLAATLLVWSSAADAEEVTVSDADGSPWAITINPGPSSRIAVDSAQIELPLPEATAAPDELAAVGSIAPTVLAPVTASATQDPGIIILPNHNGAMVDGRSYAEIYRSIPYSKTEYYANPSYRHDATMEILFGAPRPGGGGSGEGRVIENPVYTPYRPYLSAHWDWYQSHTLLRPRYYRPLYGGILWPGYQAY